MDIENVHEMDRKRAARLQTCPARDKNLLARSWVGKSRKTAIKAFCLECVGFDRSAVRECTAYACPLWMSRPFQPPVR